jgi:hypothetical protein
MKPLLFSPISMQNVTCRYRVMIAPMPTYAAIDAFARNFPFVVGRRFFNPCWRRRQRGPVDGGGKCHACLVPEYGWWLKYRAGD